jgi:DNA-binding XRE family transcriptional regulator
VTSNELKAALEELGLTQANLARLMFVTPRAVNLWMNEGRNIPGPAEAYIRLFRLLPQNLRQIELNRLKERGTGMRDGMYGITFEGPQSAGMGLLIFDAGRVYGTDSGAARYDGEYVFHENTGLADVVVKVTFPPNGVSVFGLANPYEWAIDVSASLDPKQDSGTLQVRTSLGQPLVAQFRFLRSLPEAA